MSISLDHAQAKRILFEQAAAARRGDTTPIVEAWRRRVEQLGRLCPHGRSSTVVAALGTAMLAKATDLRVDIYALLDRGEAPDSYSARSLADNVWARHRGELEIDLGANGANPLNNTPFIGKTRIDEITGVRNQVGWSHFTECMAALRDVKTTAEVGEALRGFILARSCSLLPPIQIDPQAGDDLTESTLIEAIGAFVAEDSEGGRRAQAAAAAILDALYGCERVVVGVINDPDRHAPLDISVTDGDDGFLIAMEIKDKPILEYHVRLSIEKTVKVHSLRNLGFLAVSRQQQQGNFDAVIQWAAKLGVKITVFIDWRSLYLACKCFSTSTDEVFEGTVYRQLLVRATALGVSQMGLDWLGALAGLPGQDKRT